MLRPIFVTFLWAVGVFYASALLLAFVAGLAFAAPSMPLGGSVNSHVIATGFRAGSAGVTIGLTLAALAAGFSGKLPGTRHCTSSPAA